MPRNRILSFKYALEGIWVALKHQPNLKFHFFAGYMALNLGLFFQIKPIEWIVLVLVIGLVIALELTNTAIEETVNAFTRTAHPSAKKAKDVAAGAVLVAAITSVIVGLLIFLPYIIAFLTAR